jgi:hypothetical protein
MKIVIDKLFLSVILIGGEVSMTPLVYPILSSTFRASKIS